MTDNVDYDEVRRLAGRILNGETLDDLKAERRIKEEWQEECFRVAASDPEYYSGYYPETEIGYAVLSDAFMERMAQMAREMGYEP